MKLAVADLASRLESLGADVGGLRAGVGAIEPRSSVPLGGWTIREEQLVRWKIFECLSGLTQRRRIQAVLDAVAEVFEAPGPWVETLRTVELLHREDVTLQGTSAIELWKTRSLHVVGLPPKSPALQMLRYLRAVAETHDTGAERGWHIHPVGTDGRHLQYRLLFERARGQDALAWESHGHKNLSAPWGLPSRDCLSKSRSASVHRAALRAVSVTPQLTRKGPAGHGAKFDEWSARFVHPGSKSFVAYPYVASVTPW